MGEKRSLKFKVSLVRRLEAGERITDLERESGVFRAQIYRWRDAFGREGEAGLERRPGRRRGYRRSRSAEGGPSTGPAPSAPAVAALDQLAPDVRAWVSELERTVARQQLELDFFSEALQRIEASRRPKSAAGETASTPPSRR
ncbi:helix-turn-helix domain-containing protein [Azospirillum sp. TSA6c]|uniref:helix-turn-helix domain-containing protein n=1 Tax=unclassified Azospirillum TaxID=2630922 RepID=UPI000D65A746|nr:helix-turn-helix domain-containing protein [Azospirillum sp. TSA6c]